MTDAVDLRSPAGRSLLAAQLPRIGGIQYKITAPEFEALLAELADLLGQPEWLTYRSGVVMLESRGRPFGPVSLESLLGLAFQLRDLKSFDGFDVFMRGFSNATQFHDSMFEAKVAHLMTRLPNFEGLVFSPAHEVRGSVKRPEFDVTFAGVGRVPVECKMPKLLQQRAARKFARDVEAFATEIRKGDWPSNLRLEVEFMSHAREQISGIAERVVEWASRPDSIGRSCIDTCVTAHVVLRRSPFVTPEKGFIHHSIRPTESTGVFNPHFTELRVVNNVLGRRVATSVGATLSELPSQLPTDLPCMAFIGGVDREIVNEALQPRLKDPVYRHIRIFAVWDEGPVQLIYRPEDLAFVRTFFPDATVLASS